MPAGLGKQKIPREHSHTRTETAVDGRDASAGRGLVDDVIVNQRCRVNHFGDLSKPPMTSCQLRIWRQRTRDHQDNAWSQLFAPSAEQVLCGGLENRMSSSIRLRRSDTRVSRSCSTGSSNSVTVIMQTLGAAILVAFDSLLQVNELNLWTLTKPRRCP